MSPVIGSKIESLRGQAEDGLGLPRGRPTLFYNGEGTDLQSAVSWLSGARDSVLLRLSGGCLGMEVKQHALLNVLANTFVNLSLDGYSFRGVALHGGSQSVLATQQAVVRPCFPDIAPILEPCFPEARFLGVFPGRFAEAREGGGIRICRDRVGRVEWDIIAHPAQERAMLAPEKTSYLWDAEWRHCLQLEDLIHSQRTLTRSVYMFFDGRRGVMNEILEVAERGLRDSTKRILLIESEDANSAPNVLARDLKWRLAHPNVHAIPARESLLREKLLELGLFTRTCALNPVTPAGSLGLRRAG